MRKIILLITLGIFLFPIATFAGTFGTLKGKVLEEDGGNPVPGATIMLKGTRLGAKAKDDGRFTVTNISPGEYTVTVTAVGYQPFERKVRITIDSETELIAKMTTKPVEGGEVTVTVNRVSTVDNNSIGKISSIDNQALRNTAREGVTAIVGLNAGVIAGSSGYSIRGSRANETQIRLEGQDISNQFTGGFGSAGNTYFPMVSSQATEQVQVITGGFGAEYGDALGGVVNSVVKKGKDNMYEFYARYRTDVPALWGSMADGLAVVKDPTGTRYKAINRGEGPKLQGTGEHKIEVGINGPIPYWGGSTFYLYPSYTYQDHDAGYEIYDPYGNNLGQLPNNSIWVKNITGGITFALAKDVDFTVGGQFGMTNFENNSWSWLYANDKGSIPSLWTYGLEENYVKQNVFNQLVTNAFIRVNHRLSEYDFYELTISNNLNSEASSRRTSADDPGFFTGFDLVTPEDKYKLELSELVPGFDKAIDIYQNITKIQPSDDGYVLLDRPQVNPFTGFIEGPATASGSDNPYGITQLFVDHGNTGFEYRKSSYWQVDGNYNLKIDGEFGHFIKTGFEARFSSVSRHYNGGPWENNSFFDIYTDEWGGNIYLDPSDALGDVETVKKAIEESSKPYNPIRMSAFIQDQITYKGIIISPGIRADYFNANAKYRTYKNNFVKLGADSGFAETDAKFQISPRLSITYPITTTSNIAISYGLYFKTPNLQFLYDGFNQAGALRGNSILGNPNIDPQRSTQYNVSYSNAINDDIAVSIAAYYKDIYNQVGVTYIPANPDPYFEYTVAEYGNARGIEFEIIKQPTNHIGARFNYTLSSVVGTSSDETDNYLLSLDPFTDVYQYPLKEVPLSQDRTHKVNFVLDFVWGEDEGPSIGGIHPIEKTVLDFTTVYQSGAPYTPVYLDDRPAGEVNSERTPSWWRTDMRLSREFNIKDIFGSAVGNSTIELFVDIFNIFNLTGATGLYRKTGDADDDGVSFIRTPNDFTQAIYYKEANYGNADSYATYQYSYYGERLYSSDADLNNNGRTEPDERYIKYMEYIEKARSFRPLYQAPRQVYVGFAVRF